MKGKVVKARTLLLFELTYEVNVFETEMRKFDCKELTKMQAVLAYFRDFLFIYYIVHPSRKWVVPIEMR